jgi:DNA mismatch repair ATPase MutS
MQQEEEIIEMVKEENETVQENETLENINSLQGSIYSDEENPRSQLILKELNHEDPQFNDQTDLREFSMLPIPQPYPTKDKESIVKRKAEKKVMIIRHSGPLFEKPMMNLKLEEDHIKDPKHFNFGNAEKIGQMFQNFSPKEPIPQNYEDFQPTLNSTRLIQEKLKEIEKEEFTLPEGISELPRDEKDKAHKILNYSPSDRIFHNLPAIEEIGEMEKDKAKLKKKKTKKGVNQKYLDRLAKSRSPVKLPQKTGMLIS